VDAAGGAAAGVSPDVVSGFSRTTSERTFAHALASEDDDLVEAIRAQLALMEQQLELLQLSESGQA
jgi:hypothetical protein